LPCSETENRRGGWICFTPGKTIAFFLFLRPRAHRGGGDTITNTPISLPEKRGFRSLHVSPSRGTNKGKEEELGGERKEGKTDTDGRESSPYIFEPCATRGGKKRQI